MRLRPKTPSFGTCRVGTQRVASLHRSYLGETKTFVDQTALLRYPKPEGPGRHSDVRCCVASAATASGAGFAHVWHRSEGQRRQQSGGSTGPRPRPPKLEPILSKSKDLVETKAVLSRYRDPSKEGKVVAPGIITSAKEPCFSVFFVGSNRPSDNRDSALSVESPKDRHRGNFHWANRWPCSSPALACSCMAGRPERRLWGSKEPLAWGQSPNKIDFERSYFGTTLWLIPQLQIFDNISGSW